MASIFQRIGALSSSTTLDTKKFHLSSRRSLLERKVSSLVVRSDAAKINSGVNTIGGRAHHLVANAVRWWC